jgi:hypothetical protein
MFIDSCSHAVLVHTTTWSDDHSTFVVEEFIQNGGSPIMTQHVFRSQQTKFPALVSQ